jgi:two-component system OmpR family response regulator
MRSKGIETPVLILSALGQIDDRIEGLRAGGDDYLLIIRPIESSLARCGDDGEGCPAPATSANSPDRLGSIAMPINRLLQNAFFSPDEIAVMVKAF